jgi:N-methylhydantoinase A
VLSRTHEYEFRAGMSVPSRFIKAGGYMMRVPTVDVAEVGSGAGSIAAIDAGGLLTVGPLSAGAMPGPVCYGLGGSRPTVTDANVVLGILPPQLAGGTLRLDVGAARKAIGRLLGVPLGLSVEAAAFGVRDVANANMVRAIRAVTVERGLDPRQLTLLAFGGSGPVHACDLAKILGIGRVLFPPAPGVFTAMGMLAGAVEHHERRSCAAPLASLDPAAIGLLQADMREAAEAALAADGYAAETLEFCYAINLRLDGQEAAMPLALDPRPDLAGLAALGPRFVALYRETYGYAPTDSIEAVSLTLEARHKNQGLDFLALEAGNTAAVRPSSTRPICFDRGGWVETAILDRAAITSGMAGPLIVESADTTIVVPPGATLRPGVGGSLVATLAEAGP